MRTLIQKLWMFIAALCASLSASAYDFKTDDGLYYDILSEEDRTVEVTGYYSSILPINIDIPREVICDSRTYTVTSIGTDAFEDCSSLTSVTIPSSVTFIKAYAFSGCSSLTSVTIPSSVTYIGDYAFEDCSSLENINVDSGNSNYSSIDGILYNKDATSLIRCPGAKSNVTIPNSVTSIEVNAFIFCSSLTSVTIPNSVISIGYQAFCGCSSLTSVTIPNSVTYIGEGAFHMCSSLTSVTIPNSVTSIGSVFSECTSLTSVTIPNSVTSIGINAFCGCSSLTSVTIPNSVTSIGCQAFYHCSSLTSVAIPNSVTYIDDFAFAGCSSLRSVTIPNSVTYIGDDAFYYSDNLKTIYMQREVPIRCDPGFGVNSLNKALLYVPMGTKAKYRKVRPWYNFSNIQEMNFSGIDGIVADEFGTPHISVTNGILTIDGIGSHESVTVCDMEGRIFYNGTSHTIDKLTPGLYIVKAGSRSIKISI